MLPVPRSAHHAPLLIVQCIATPIYQCISFRGRWALLYMTRRGATARVALLPSAAVPAGQEADDDAEEGHDGADEGVQDVADARDDGHDGCADGPEDGRDLNKKRAC